MIGDKITINGIEWEEISRDEYLDLEWDDRAELVNNETNPIYYKKVQKEVFPKVFDGDYIIISITKKCSFEFKHWTDNRYSTIMHFTKRDIEALEQALAFRNKMLEEKEKI
jgi:hypothetical protein